jgi:hypothetical protein
VLKAILKPLLAYLLCVLIVFASVDRVPDPPVLKPHHDKAAKLCFDGQHRLPSDHDSIIEQALLHPVFLRAGFTWDIPCESTSQPRPAVVFRYHVSDTSPPFSAA